MTRVGIIGWRGMVGSVLMKRMMEENDFQGYKPTFFSTSQAGQKGPDLGFETGTLEDAFDIKRLASQDIILTCQGGSYTSRVYQELRDSGWKGYWIDAASTLRMDKDSIIALDPVNMDIIKEGLPKGVKNYIGGNCTVSLMLMALGGLFKANLAEWITSMTYQAASGAGAANMRELLSQMGTIHRAAADKLADRNSSIVEIDDLVTSALRGSTIETEKFGAPLAGSLLAWIDSAVEAGQTREEWKGFAETNKILGNEKPIPIDGICVRIGSMRCHSQGITIKLTKDISTEEVTDIIRGSNQWVKVVENTKEATIAELTPTAVTGTLSVPVGRIHKMNLGPRYLTLFTVGDQLLWGAAEPVRRMLQIVLEFLGS